MIHILLKITVLTSWNFPLAMYPSSVEKKNLWSYFCNMWCRKAQITRIYYRSVCTGRIEMKTTLRYVTQWLWSQSWAEPIPLWVLTDRKCNVWPQHWFDFKLGFCNCACSSTKLSRSKVVGVPCWCGLGNLGHILKTNKQKDIGT